MMRKGKKSVDRMLVRKKLSELRRYVRELERFRNRKPSTLQKSLSQIWSIEHGLQLAIQIVIDVGNHLLAAQGINEIEDYRDVVEKMGTHRVLPKAFARKIRAMTGFRNILVHEYTQVNLRIVLRVINRNLPDFLKFVQYIERYLSPY